MSIHDTDTPNKPSQTPADPTCPTCGDDRPPVDLPLSALVDRLEVAKGTYREQRATITQLQAEIARLDATLQTLQAGPAPGPDPLAAAAWLDPDARCPRCGDALQLVHVPADLSRPSTDWPRTPNDWRPTHVLGCRSYPQCTYTEPYDAPLHDLLAGMQARLIWLTAQYCWLLGEVETLAARAREEALP